MEQNPFAIGFGKIPRQFISRDLIVEEILLELAGKKKNEFSQYRVRLRDKGLIDVSQRGKIRYTLPRFDVFVRGEMEEGLWHS